MKRLLPAVLLLALLASTVRAKEFIWREAENAAVNTFNHDGWYEGSSNIDRTLLSPGYPGGAQGAWSAHYVLHADSPAYVQWDDITVTEGGAYTWWIRLAPTNTSYTYSIDGGPAVAMDLSRQHEVMDPARPGLMDDLHFLGWVDVGQLDLGSGPHTLRVTAVYNAAHDSTVGGIDCMCLLNFPWTPTGTLQPGGSTNPDPAPGPGVWYPLHVGQDEFSDRSIIDMRSLVAATTGIPAGVQGHLTRVQDHFELSGRPGTPVKFWGICATEPSMYLSSDPAMPSLYATQARFYVKHGINLVRRHPMIGDVGQDMDAGAMDDYDRWFAALKAQGIYTDWSVFYPDSVPVSRSFLPATPDADFLALCSRAGVTPDDLWNELPDGGTAGTKKLGGMDCFVDWYQAGEWNWERNLLLHTNPYTGMRYVDDPALAIVEVQNEDSIFWWWPLSNLSGQATPYYPNHAMLLRRMWFEWLQKKYADDAALAAAWGSGMQAGDSVETFHTDMMLYSPWNMADDGPPYAADQKARMGDFIRFLAETQRAVFQKRFDNVTALGFQGVQVSTAWKAGGPAGEAANLWADDAGDAIDRHAYMGGTTDGSGWYVSTGGVNNDIQLSAPGRFILGGENFTTTPRPHLALPGRGQAGHDDGVERRPADEVARRDGAALRLLRHGPAGVGRLVPLRRQPPVDGDGLAGPVLRPLAFRQRDAPLHGPVPGARLRRLPRPRPAGGPGRRPPHLAGRPVQRRRPRLPAPAGRRLQRSGQRLHPARGQRHRPRHLQGGRLAQLLRLDPVGLEQLLGPVRPDHHQHDGPARLGLRQPRRAGQDAEDRGPHRLVRRPRGL